MRLVEISCIKASFEHTRALSRMSTMSPADLVMQSIEESSTRQNSRAIISSMQFAVNTIQTALPLGSNITSTAFASDWHRGTALYNNRHYKDALAEFQDIVLERPDAAGAWYYIGLCQFKLKRYDRVEVPLSHAIDLLEIQTPTTPDIAGAWYTIGISHYLQANYDKAIAALNRYIDINEKAKREVDASARTALARSYYSLERYDEALPLLAAASREKANSTDERIKENAVNNYYLGAIYFKREDDDHAIVALREAVKLNPDDVAAMELLAESLMRKARKANSDARWIEAAEVGERLKLVRDDMKTANILGRAYLGAKKFDSAVAPLEKLAKANTDNGQAWLYYGIALSRSGQMRKAMEALEITIQLIPDSIPALSELGYVYESDKQYQQALRIYEKAYAASNDPAIKAIVDRVRALAAQQPSEVWPFFLGTERGKRFRFVIECLKHRNQFCDCKQILNAFCKIDQLEPSAVALDRGVAADERSETSRINIVYFRQVQQNPPLPVAQQVLDSVFQLNVAFAQHDLARHIEYADSSNNSLFDIHSGLLLRLVKLSQRHLPGKAALPLYDLHLDADLYSSLRWGRLFPTGKFYGCVSTRRENDMLRKISLATCGVLDALVLCSYDTRVAAHLPKAATVDCVGDCKQRLRDKTAVCNDLYESKGSAHYHDTQWHKECLANAKSEYDSCLAACKGH